MKNKIKIRYIIATILVLVVLIAIIIFIKGIKADTKANQDSMAEIKTSYQLLEDNISTYNETRNTLATSIENYYTENLATDYSKYIAILFNFSRVGTFIYSLISKLVSSNWFINSSPLSKL